MSSERVDLWHAGARIAEEVMGVGEGEVGWAIEQEDGNVELPRSCDDLREALNRPAFVRASAARMNSNWIDIAIGLRVVPEERGWIAQLLPILVVGTSQEDADAKVDIYQARSQ